MIICLLCKGKVIIVCLWGDFLGGRLDYLEGRSDGKVRPPFNGRLDTVKVKTNWA